MTVNSASGDFSWAPPQTNSPSTNIVSVAVVNNGTLPLTATNTFTVVVREVNVPPSLPTIATQIVNELTLLTVTNSAMDPNIHSTITGYTLLNAPSNMVINGGGIITWTPTQAQSPVTNLITTIVTNSNPYDLINPSLTSTNFFPVIVREVNVAPDLPAISPQIATLLQLFTITNAATESNIHSTNAGYVLRAAPSGMMIDSRGVISWTPAASEALTTNPVTTVAINGNPYDLITPRLSATNSFTVIALHQRA
jgi:hypothetical protein